MKTSLLLLLGYCLTQGQIAYSAEENCQQLMSVEGGDLAAFLAQNGDSTFLQVNFDEGMICSLPDSSLDIDVSTASGFHINSSLDELVVRATVDGFETWLRLDDEFDGELLLDRKTSEGLGLTEAEFLGDNSQLEASDFFVEYVGSLQIGELTLRNVETTIPLLEVPYDHYAGREPKPEMSSSESEFLSVGSIGSELLEDVIITLDVTNERLYLTDVE